MKIVWSIILHTITLWIGFQGVICAQSKIFESYAGDSTFTDVHCFVDTLYSPDWNLNDNYVLDKVIKPGLGRAKNLNFILLTDSSIPTFRAIEGSNGIVLSFQPFLNCLRMECDLDELLLIAIPMTIKNYPFNSFSLDRVRLYSSTQYIKKVVDFDSLVNSSFETFFCYKFLLYRESGGCDNFELCRNDEYPKDSSITIKKGPLFTQRRVANFFFYLLLKPKKIYLKDFAKPLFLSEEILDYGLCNPISNLSRALYDSLSYKKYSPNYSIEVFNLTSNPRFVPSFVFSALPDIRKYYTTVESSRVSMFFYFNSEEMYTAPFVVSHPFITPLIKFKRLIER